MFGEVQSVNTIPKGGESFHIPIGKIILDEKRTEVNISNTMIMIEKVINGIEEQLIPQFTNKKILLYIFIIFKFKYVLYKITLL